MLIKYLICMKMKMRGVLFYTVMANLKQKDKIEIFNF